MQLLLDSFALHVWCYKGNNCALSCPVARLPITGKRSGYQMAPRNTCRHAVSTRLTVMQLQGGLRGQLRQVQLQGGMQLKECSSRVGLAKMAAGSIQLQPTIDIDRNISNRPLLYNCREGRDAPAKPHSVTCAPQPQSISSSALLPCTADTTLHGLIRLATV